MKADILDMKRTVGLSALVVAMLMLTGCFGDGSAPDGNDPVVSTEIEYTAYNPLVAGVEAPVAVSEQPGFTVNVYYAGLGYPNLSEVAQFDGGKGEGTQLVSDRRVVGVAYKVTNTTGEAIPFTELTWDTPTLNDIESSTASSITSLTAMAGYATAPQQYEGMEIQPGETLTWSFVVDIPEDLQDSGQVTFKQNVTWGETIIPVEFIFSTEEPELTTPEPTETPTENSEG